jgi:hypothetical protein
METIGIITEKLIQSWQRSPGKEHNEAVKAGLDNLLTKQDKKHVKSCSICDKQVILSVDSSAWLYLLALKKRQLLKNLNSVLPPDIKIINLVLRLERSRQER